MGKCAGGGGALSSNAPPEALTDHGGCCGSLHIVGVCVCVCLCVDARLGVCVSVCLCVYIIYTM